MQKRRWVTRLTRRIVLMKRVGTGMNSAQRFTQFTAEDFARRSARDGIDEMHFAGLFVVREAIGNEASQLVS